MAAPAYQLGQEKLYKFLQKLFASWSNVIQKPKITFSAVVFYLQQGWLQSEYYENPKKLEQKCISIQTYPFHPSLQPL